MNPANYRKELTEKIIQALENGTAPWVKPWDENKAAPGMPFNAVSERSYHGGNCLWLQCQPFDDPRWCTYKQAQQHGWQVIKGEKASVVEYWQWDEQQKDASGQVVRVQLEHPRVFYSHVFNVQQMQNVPALAPIGAHQWQPEDAADRILRQANPKLFHDQLNKAFYSPSRDEIHLPAKELFPSAKQYYATALHELGHWTGHESRLGRDLANSFGSQEYAREELRAELSSYFMSARIGIPHDPSQHAAYIDSWIQVLREDHNEIFRAAKDAEQITEYVLQFQQEKHLHVELKHAEVNQLEEELEC
jgi:antirestriction protein ArdC